MKAQSSIKDALGKILVDVAISRIENFGNRELKRAKASKHNNLPTILELQNNIFQVGSYTLVIRGSHNYPVYHNDRVVHVFYSKVAALLYCILSTEKNYKRADELSVLDKNVGIHYQDAELFSQLLKRKNLDSFKLQLYTNRYSQARTQYVHAKESLEKTLTTTKYSKLQDFL